MPSLPSMKITLTENDIKTACREYIKKQWALPIEAVSLKITRGYEHQYGMSQPDSVEVTVTVTNPHTEDDTGGGDGICMCGTADTITVRSWCVDCKKYVDPR